MPSNASSQKTTKRTRSSASLAVSAPVKNPEKSTAWVPKVVSAQQTLADAFPDVDPGLRPFGSRVLIQIRTPREVSDGGIIIPGETQETEKWNTTIAKVVALGPGAFRNRDTLELWPEGEWAKVGDYIWCPKYGGQRHELKIRGRKNRAMFVTVNDLDLIGDCTIDPLSIIMFV